MKKAGGSGEQRTDTLVFESVWEALSDNADEANMLSLRSDLVQEINAIIKVNDLTKNEVATICGISQNQVNELLQGRISKFDNDALVIMKDKIQDMLNSEIKHAVLIMERVKAGKEKLYTSDEVKKILGF